MEPNFDLLILQTLLQILGLQQEDTVLGDILLGQWVGLEDTVRGIREDVQQNISSNYDNEADQRNVEVFVEQLNMFLLGAADCYVTTQCDEFIYSLVAESETPLDTAFTAELRADLANLFRRETDQDVVPLHMLDWETELPEVVARNVRARFQSYANQLRAQFESHQVGEGSIGEEPAAPTEQASAHVPSQPVLTFAQRLEQQVQAQQLARPTRTDWQTVFATVYAGGAQTVRTGTGRTRARYKLQSIVHDQRKNGVDGYILWFTAFSPTTLQNWPDTREHPHMVVGLTELQLANLLKRIECNEQLHAVECDCSTCVVRNDELIRLQRAGSLTTELVEAGHQQIVRPSLIEGAEVLADLPEQQITLEMHQALLDAVIQGPQGEDCRLLAWGTAYNRASDIKPRLLVTITNSNGVQAYPVPGGMDYLHRVAYSTKTSVAAHRPDCVCTACECAYVFVQLWPFGSKRAADCPAVTIRDRGELVRITPDPANHRVSLLSVIESSLMAGYTNVPEAGFEDYRLYLQQCAADHRVADNYEAYVSRRDARLVNEALLDRLSQPASPQVQAEAAAVIDFTRQRLRQEQPAQSSNQLLFQTPPTVEELLEEPTTSEAAERPPAFTIYTPPSFDELNSQSPLGTTYGQDYEYEASVLLPNSTEYATLENVERVGDNIVEMVFAYPDGRSVTEIVSMEAYIHWVVLARATVLTPNTHSRLWSPQHLEHAVAEPIWPEMVDMQECLRTILTAVGAPTPVTAAGSSQITPGPPTFRELQDSQLFGPMNEFHVNIDGQYMLTDAVLHATSHEVRVQLRNRSSSATQSHNMPEEEYVAWVLYVRLVAVGRVHPERITVPPPVTPPGLINSPWSVVSPPGSTARRLRTMIANQALPANPNPQQPQAMDAIAPGPGANTPSGLGVPTPIGLPLSSNQLLNSAQSAAAFDDAALRRHAQFGLAFGAGPQTLAQFDNQAVPTGRQGATPNFQNMTAPLNSLARRAQQVRQDVQRAFPPANTAAASEDQPPTPEAEPPPAELISREEWQRHIDAIRQNLRTGRSSARNPPLTAIPSQNQPASPETRDALIRRVFGPFPTRHWLLQPIVQNIPRLWLPQPADPMTTPQATEPQPPQAGEPELPQPPQPTG